MEIDGTKTPGGLWKAASEGLRNLKTPHIDEMGLEEITPIQKTRGSFPSDMSETPVSGIGSINVTALSSSVRFLLFRGISNGKGIILFLLSTGQKTNEEIPTGNGPRNP